MKILSAKKVISNTAGILLIAVILSGVLVSCSGNDAPPALSETVAETKAVETQDENLRKNAKDNLPELDFGGKEMRFLHRGSAPNLGDPDLRLEIDAEESGEVVNTALHDRKLSVENRLNIGVKILTADEGIDSGAAMNKLIRASVTAGSDDYDILLNHMSQATPLASEGLLYNLNTFKYLDFAQPWWSESFADAAQIYDQLYFAAGDISLCKLQSTYVFYYNKDMYASYFTDSLYDTIKSGSWTLDKLGELCGSVYSDLNGNGVTDIDDLYGYVAQSGNYIDSLVGGSNVILSRRDSEGLPYLVYNKEEHTFDFLEKIISILHHGQLAWYTPSNTDVSVLVTKLKNETGLFASGRFASADSYRDMESDFGIVPVPKFDEAQEKYTNWIHNAFSTVSVPVTCSDIDAAAATIEAMCAEGYRSVVPAYYETALKVKYSRDDETSQMLDMISDSVVFDFAFIYSASLSNVMQQFRELVKLNSGTAASTMESNYPKFEAKLETLLASFESMK